MLARNSALKEQPLTNERPDRNDHSKPGDDANFAVGEPILRAMQANSMPTAGILYGECLNSQ